MPADEQGNFCGTQGMVQHMRDNMDISHEMAVRNTHPARDVSTSAARVERGSDVVGEAPNAPQKGRSSRPPSRRARHPQRPLCHPTPPQPQPAATAATVAAVHEELPNSTWGVSHRGGPPDDAQQPSSSGSALDLHANHGEEVQQAVHPGCRHYCQTQCGSERHRARS